MFFQLMLTTECNLKCRYCYGEALEDVDADFPDFEIDYCLPKRMSYDVDSLDRFCRQHPKCVLTFYGGEPLLCTDDIRHILGNVKAKHYSINLEEAFLQTVNGYVLRFIGVKSYILTLIFLHTRLVEIVLPHEQHKKFECDRSSKASQKPIFTR